MFNFSNHFETLVSLSLLQMHLLCYIAHLRVWVRTLTRHEVLASLCLSLIPEGYVAAAELAFDVPTAERFLKWFRSAFEVAKENYFAKNGLCSSQVNHVLHFEDKSCFKSV